MATPKRETITIRKPYFHASIASHTVRDWPENYLPPNLRGGFRCEQVLAERCRAERPNATITIVRA